MSKSKFFHLNHLLRCLLVSGCYLQIFHRLYYFKLILVHHRLLIFFLFVVIITDIVVLLKLVGMDGLAHLITFVDLLLDVVQLLQVVSVKMLLLGFINIYEGRI